MNAQGSIASQEQVMLRDAASAWVRDHAPVSAIRRLRREFAAQGFDPALWRDMADMGWTGMIVPEAEGGFGFGFSAMGMLAEELGRNLVASPLLGAAMVADALVLAGSARQKAEWLPKLISGEGHGALAVDEGRTHDPAMVAATAKREGASWLIEGTKRPVCEAVGASVMLVSATTGGSVTLFLVPGSAKGLELTPMQQIDSRGAAIVGLSSVQLGSDAVLGAPGQGQSLLETVLDRGRCMLAAEMLGSAQQAFETTVEYLKTRVQFDRPIGSFQALQHRAAGLLADLELTRSAVYAALAAIDAGDSDLPRLASLAKALAGDTFRKVSREMVQMHGGIGMTDEHDAGLYLKRAAVADMLLGNAAYHRDRYARLSGF